MRGAGKKVGFCADVDARAVAALKQYFAEGLLHRHLIPRPYYIVLRVSCPDRLGCICVWGDVALLVQPLVRARLCER